LLPAWQYISAALLQEIVLPPKKNKAQKAGQTEQDHQDPSSKCMAMWGGCRGPRRPVSEEVLLWKFIFPVAEMSSMFLLSTNNMYIVYIYIYIFILHIYIYIHFYFTYIYIFTCKGSGTR